MHKSLKPMNFTYFGLDGDDEDQLLVTGSIVMQSVKHLVRFRFFSWCSSVTRARVCVCVCVCVRACVSCDSSRQRDVGAVEGRLHHSALQPDHHRRTTHRFVHNTHTRTHTHTHTHSTSCSSWRFTDNTHHIHQVAASTQDKTWISASFDTEIRGVWSHLWGSHDVNARKCHRAAQRLSLKTKTTREIDCAPLERTHLWVLRPVSNTDVGRSLNPESSHQTKMKPLSLKSLESLKVCRRSAGKFSGFSFRLSRLTNFNTHTWHSFLNSPFIYGK